MNLVKQNIKDAKKIFSKYDEQQRGYICYEDLRELFQDIGLQEKYKEHFDDFLRHQFEFFDTNGVRRKANDRTE